MDKICAIAKKHNVKVIEDVSHAHGGRYKGQMVRTARIVLLVGGGRFFAQPSRLGVNALCVCARARA